MERAKRGLLVSAIFVSLISFVSAQFYGRFSIRNFFATLDPQTVTLSVFFVIFFGLIYFALSKIFKTPTGEPNKGIAGTISIALSFLIVYGIYRTGFDLGNVFFSIGVPVDFFYSIMPFLLLALAIFLIWWFTFSTFLMAFGVFSIAVTFIPNLIYERGIAWIIGIVFILAGFFLRRRKGINLPVSPGFRYKQGMRRGGEKPNRNQFVSKNASERYARRYGKWAARRRFRR